MVEEILLTFIGLKCLPGNPKVLNSYLVRGGQRNLLIDTGFNREECRRLC